MTTIAFHMPNEGHLGGFEIRRFLQKYMTVGLVVSVLVHALAVGSYYFVLYMMSRDVPPPSRVIYLDPSNLGPPPSLSGEDTAPALKIAQPKLAPPAAAIPKPVAEDVAPEEPQITSQTELSDILNSQVDPLALGGSGENLDIRQEIPQDDVIPDAGTFTPYEQAPQIVTRVQPEYPDMAKTAEVDGKVVVQFYVDKKGDVKKAKAVQAKPSGLGFEEAAVAAVLKWKFTPALQRENPVGVWVAYTINFTVKGK
ncbi:MAG: energy transducer TonB [bacterium]|nr:energy transducer TonB [bacterium]